MLQTLGSNQSFSSHEPAFGSDQGSSLDLSLIADIFKRRFFVFLFPFGLVAILGMLFAALQKPNYVSEGKILLEAQILAPDIVRPVITASATERVQLIQQRVATRDSLLAIANKFGLFPNQTGVLDLMRESLQFKPIVIDSQSRMNSSAVAFTVGFQYSDPKVALQVANELVSLIVSEDERSRSDRATEAVRILSGETKDIESKLEATQALILEAERRPVDAAPTMSEQQKLQLNALAALRAELIQKMAVYSDAHPAVTALKKRIAAMEKTVQAPPPAPSQSAPTDDIESLKRQREALEKRLGESNAKLATARLTEKLTRDQQSERLQIIETPTMPQKPAKSNRLKMVAIAFVAAIMAGIGSALAVEFLNGSIRSARQLSGVVAGSLVVSIPYMTTRGDVIRAWARFAFGAFCLVTLLAILAGLAAAIVLNLPLDPSKAWLALRAAAGQ